MRGQSRAVVAFLLGLAVAVGGRSMAATGIEIVDVGRFNFTGGGSNDPRLVAEELSGFARMRGDRYASVGDDHATLYFLEIAVDSRSGRVRSVSFDRPLPLRDARGRLLAGPGQSADREDVAWDPGRGTVWIADERDSGDPSRPSLVEVNPANGREVGRMSAAPDGPLSVYGAIRRNYGFEAVARAEGSHAMWTANEEALTIDGPVASPSDGSIVRLQQIDEYGGPTRQVAYVTDPTDHPISSPSGAVGEDRSGVSALVAFADGRLLVLERALAGDAVGTGGFRIRIYLAEPAGATDVSAAPFRSGLAGRSGWRPVRKTRLFERWFGLPVSNFEGMALGPRLSNGDRSLLLLADNGGGTWQSIYALRLRGEP
ncbi:MAG TPA: esterase-like activity of phytase family protein [Gemmatimonadota bacterium]|jgi:hypothetical protein